MKTLCLIPARKGSKSIPGKNKKYLSGKPLISYTIDVALQYFNKEDICLSTDDKDIVDIGLNHGLIHHFDRPSRLSEDSTPMKDVMLHSIDHFAQNGMLYDSITLLQPTSPFRQEKHLIESASLFRQEVDMVISARIAKANPYYVLFEEDVNNFLVKSKSGNFTTRQECPTVYELNGSIAIINVNSLRQQDLADFKKIVKYEMPDLYSLDLDTDIDWKFAEFLVESKILELN